MPQLLSDAVKQATLLSAEQPDGEPVERIHWVEFFTDKARYTEFCEATDPRGDLESNSSSGHKEYQDRLRAIALRSEGKEKGEIAATLGRSTKFVQTWWKKEPKEVPRPPGVHEYLKTEFWRDIQIVRGFGKGLGIYDEVLPATEWVQDMANGPEFRGGGSRLKYDKEGRMRPQGNQYARDGLLPGRYPQLDKLTQKLLVEQSIDDRVLKRPGVLWYPDGSSDAIEHRHEAWTALLSFGSPRILLIDKQPILLRDGDLIVFGTQRHGVPKMHLEGRTPEDYGGRMSVVFFFMPTGEQAQGAAPWRAIVDGDQPSRKAVAMLRDADLGSTAAVKGLQTGARAADVTMLTDLGFTVEEAAAALKATGFDVERAAEALLCTGGAELLEVMGGGAGGFAGTEAGPSRTAEISALYRRLEALQSQKKAARSSSSGTGCVGGDADESDEATALRLQEQEGAGLGPDAAGDWEELAILEQLQELEQHFGGGDDAEALSKQFAAYDDMLDAQDAADWDGRGDLMVRTWRREHLHIEQVDPVSLYAFGCGKLSEQAFFEILSTHSIRALYDFRANPEAAVFQHFQVRPLELACKARGITYRHIALGREGAYGILKHLREDEGRNALAEVVWHAGRKRTGFLGSEEDWRADHRLAIAARLREAGHRVLHVDSIGATEEHPERIAMPDHLSGEEARLRLLEKQRLAGELRKPVKSAVSRSTEVVAQKLMLPPKVIDAGAELRKADTQAELVRVQRRLADLQRRSEDSADIQAGLGPKLLHVNKWVKAQAEDQRQNLAAGKTKDGKEKGAVKVGGTAPAGSWLGHGGTAGGNPDFGAAPAAGASSSSTATGTLAGQAAAEQPVAEADAEAQREGGGEILLVECLGSCGGSFPWDALQEGDGYCPGCAWTMTLAAAPAELPGLPLAASAESAAAPNVAAASPAADARSADAELPPQVAAPAVATTCSSSWRSRRRQQRELPGADPEADLHRRWCGSRAEPAA